jgi:hypothetical protein
MKPIYFPFTYVPRNVAHALAAIFGGFIVYQPSGKKLPDEMQSWVEAGVMEIRVPDQTDDQGLEKVVKDFRSFANLHSDSQDLKTAALLGRQGAIPFFNESSTSRIMAELKKGGASDSSIKGSDPLFCARVFLGFAQDFDRQGDELNRGLGIHEQQSSEMLKTLKGEPELDPAVFAPQAGSGIPDPGEYMAQARLQAWAQLFQKDPVGSGLFVTSSKTVFNQMMAKVPAAEEIVQSQGLPVNEIEAKALSAWRDSFLKQLNHLAETHGSASEDMGLKPSFEGANGTNLRLTLYLAPGQIPSDFFAPYLDAQQPPEKKTDQKAKIKNTLVGLVECQ